MRTSSNYALLVTASKDQTVIIWNFSTMTPLKVLIQPSVINDVGINPIDNSIVVLLNNGSVNIYNSATYALVTSFAYPNSGHGNTIVFINNGTQYILGGLDNGMAPKIHIYNSATNIIVSTLPTSFASGTSIKKIKVFYNALLAVISDQSTLIYPTLLFSLQYSMMIKQFIDSNGVLNDVGFVLDGSALYSVGQDYALRNMTKSPFNNLY